MNLRYSGKAIAAFVLLFSVCACGAILKDEGAFDRDVPIINAAKEIQAEQLPARPVADFMPLNLGNSWTYGHRLFNKEGKTKVTIKGKDGRFFVDDQGGRLMVDSSGLRDKNRYLIHSPAVKGARWSSRLSIVQTEDFEITDDNFEITTPAGFFKGCLVVRSETVPAKNVKMVLETVYAPRIGMVRMRTTIEKGGEKPVVQAEMELLSYEIP